jgi:hypothetical protein
MAITKATQNVISANICTTDTIQTVSGQKTFTQPILANVINPNSVQIGQSATATQNFTLAVPSLPDGTIKLARGNSGATTQDVLSVGSNGQLGVTGFGNIPVNTPGFFYQAPTDKTAISAYKNSSTDTSSAATFVKYANAGALTTQQNPALYSVAFKQNNTSTSRVQGIYSEAIDNAGGNGTFVEGGRFAGINCTSNLNGDVYGVIAYAQSGDGTNTPNSSFCIGIESETVYFHSVLAPAPRSFNPNRFSAAFLATNRNGITGDVAFAVNPYTEVSWKAGFVVEKSVSPGQVTDVAFGCYQTGVVYGIDLAKGSYTFAAISIPNNSPIRAFDSSGVNELNILYLGTDNFTILGIESLGVKTKTVVPNTDLTFELGGGANRWNNVWTKAVTMNTGASFTSGTGSPEGVVSAFVGSVYLNTSGGATTTLYIKTSGGSGNTGWTAK